MMEEPSVLLAIRGQRQCQRQGGHDRMSKLDQLMPQKYVLAYFLPIIIFLIIDQSLGREYYSFPNDNIPGQFGLAQNLLYGEFQIRFGHPAYSLIFLESLLVLPVQGDETLDAFYWMGFGLNIVFAIIASVLVALFSNILRLPLYIPALLSLVAISMPTVALYAPLLVIYAPLGFLSPALALGLYIVVVSATRKRWVITVVLALFGFFLANLFLVVPIVLGAMVGFVWLAYKEGLDSFLSRLSTVPETRSWPVIAGILAVLVFLIRNMLDIPRDILRHSGIIKLSSDFAWGVTAVIAIAALYFILRKAVAWRFWWAWVAPMAIGWVLSCNFLVRFWGATAAEKMRKTAALFTDPDSTHPNIVVTPDYWGFLTAWSWHWLPIVSVVLAFLAIAESTRREGVTTRAVFALIFIGVSLLLTFFMAGNAILVEPNVITAYGQTSRMIIMSLIVVAYILVMIERSSSKFLRRGGVATVLAIVALSFGDYVFAARSVMPVYNEIEEQLQQAVDTHLAQDPGNNITCLRTVQPRPCATLYGINNYRLGKSKAAFQKLTVRNGRIRYAKNYAKACPGPEHCDTSTLFIGSPPDDIMKNDKILAIVHDPLESSIIAFKFPPR